MVGLYLFIGDTVNGLPRFCLLQKNIYNVQILNIMMLQLCLIYCLIRFVD